jgi:hypothetical protein
MSPLHWAPTRPITIMDSLIMAYLLDTTLWEVQIQQAPGEPPIVTGPVTVNRIDRGSGRVGLLGVDGKSWLVSIEAVQQVTEYPGAVQQHQYRMPGVV